MARCIEAAATGEQGDPEEREVGFILLARALWDLKLIRKAHGGQ